jgi:hypothetical protein
MRKYIIIEVVSLAFLLSGCSLFHYYEDKKSQIEIEQYENPMIWREVLQVQNTLWPLEKKVNKLEKNLNEMKEELATARSSSIEAEKNIESLKAEIQQIKSESSSKEKTAVESPLEKTNKREIPKEVTAKVTAESKKASPAIPLVTINDIQYSKISDTQDKVLIYVNARNNPKLQTLKGENPRIVLDFLNARNIGKEKYEINTNGNYIKRIRIGSYREPQQKVRIVFDMVPNKKYSVEQKFSKEENFYSFDIIPFELK